MTKTELKKRIKTIGLELARIQLEADSLLNEIVVDRDQGRISDNTVDAISSLGAVIGVAQATAKSTINEVM